ncbi:MULTISPECIES: hypothetical protein [unclassified Streptomyces]|uniref:hypothetical protein n=1 Tax=unclassified Streptomyces TaxID=2593676 RepID=UPI00158787C5|nr:MULTISPECIES: hypothetical protein [unclassified Streptomyces]
MSTQTAAPGGHSQDQGSSRPVSLAREVQGRVRTCRPARTDREPEDPAQEWNIVLGED